MPTHIQRTKSLYGKLNTLAYQALEGAAIFCKTRQYATVDLVQWLRELLRLPDSDVHRIIAKFDLDGARISEGITKLLSTASKGSGQFSFSRDLDRAIEWAWTFATIDRGEAQVRSGYMFLAFVKNRDLRFLLTDLSPEFDKLGADQLSAALDEILASSPEEGLTAKDGFGAGQKGAAAAPGLDVVPGRGGEAQALAKFSVDLTEKARKGLLDPVVGRDEEIRQLVDVLMRRRQNNPLLAGEAGVGKTAVVEGFALRIVSGDVPPALKGVALRSLDIGLLQAGASMKGEFEQRLRNVIDEVQNSATPIILFIDEVHTLIGAGGSAGTGDAANLLKPALARGTLRTVAATTWDEYKRHIEKDPALTRRFQVIKVDEPSEGKAIDMLRGSIGMLEKHHGVLVFDDAIDTAVRFSSRYIPSRQLPDKAVSLLDTACARVAVSQHAVPAAIDDLRARIVNLDTELAVVDREISIGTEHGERSRNLRATREAAATELKGLEERWANEKKLASDIFAVRAVLQSRLPGYVAKEGAPKPDDALVALDSEALKARLKEAQAGLATLQGESPLIFPSVDQAAIADVVADWTGIPVGRMVKNEIAQVLGLAEVMEKRVIGQRHALNAVAQRIQTSRAKIDNPNRPVGVFMLVGPSGTGKTETALALAESLYGGEQNIISINMSEFQEAHTVSTLKGSPPGYVGYGEGGILTEAVRRRPYSVVLLDEVEKAHRDVHEIFFQVFDKGWMEDAEGRFIDFKNTIILLTSNAAQDVIINMCERSKEKPSAEVLEQAMRQPLTEVFPDALLNRLVVVPYYPISRDILMLIIKLNLSKLRSRIEGNHKIPFTYDEAVLDFIARRCTELERGARMIDALITNSLLPLIGRELLTRSVEGRDLKRVHLSAKDGAFDLAYD